MPSQEPCQKSPFRSRCGVLAFFWRRSPSTFADCFLRFDTNADRTNQSNVQGENFLRNHPPTDIRASNRLKQQSMVVKFMARMSMHSRPKSRARNRPMGQGEPDMSLGPHRDLGRVAVGIAALAARRPGWPDPQSFDRFKAGAVREVPERRRANSVARSAARWKYERHACDRDGKCRGWAWRDGLRRSPLRLDADPLLRAGASRRYGCIIRDCNATRRGRADPRNRLCVRWQHHSTRRALSARALHRHRSFRKARCRWP